MFARIETHFNLRTCQGPGCGYYTEPSKSVLIVNPENLKAGKVFGARHRFKICTGPRYLGGYIGENQCISDWLRERTLTWNKKNWHDQKNYGEISPG